MNYIVLDLEWNQSSDSRSRELKELPFEIIEIGAVKLDETMNIISSFCEVICPVVYKELHYKLVELTHLSNDILSQGKPFAEVFDRFSKWCGDDFIICTWGPMDITELQKNMHYYNIPLFKTPVFFYDIQKVFSILYEDRKIRRSLEWAVDFLNITKEHSFHRALSDAYYTAMIMNIMTLPNIEKHYSIDCYQNPKTREEQIYVIYDTYSKFISREFDNKTDILKDKQINATTCYKCGQRTKKKIRWFSDNAKTYYCLGYCNEHGWLKGKIRLKKTDNDKVYAIKTLKLTDDDGANAIRQRQTDIRKRRQKNRLVKA